MNVRVATKRPRKIECTVICFTGSGSTLRPYFSIHVLVFVATSVSLTKAGGTWKIVAGDSGRGC